MTDVPPDAIDAATLSLAEDVLPTFVVAESPDGKVLSHDGGFPDDNTRVWVESEDPSAARPLADLYAQYGEDVIAYAEPEPAAVTASLESEQHVDPVTTTANAAMEPPPDPEPVPDRAAVTAAMIRQAGTEALDEIEAFLDSAEDALAVTAAMNAPTMEGRVVPLVTMRMAIGGNDAAQADIVAAFEQHYDRNVDEFIGTVLGDRPDDDANHDGEAWDAIAREARLWHANQMAEAAAYRTKGT